MSRSIPEATVARLPLYLQSLVESSENAVETISSTALADASGVNAAIVRKDLSQLGAFGTRGVGYRVGELIDEISEVLGLNRDRAVVIVGIGNLGRALAAYDGFSRRGFNVVGLFDESVDLVGSEVGNGVVEPVADLDRAVLERGATIAVIATPAEHAQSIVDRLVAAGVTAILNFAPTHVDTPEHVAVRKVDVSTELQILSFYEQLYATPGPERQVATGT
ncbi:redox-sensing transcriptional repressor Rex [Salsipaludibacter albus]|uniref:redox-sensing transcriptional repressor Rex n=1 Tax=Salsipaludibacter albus TaxID=2849650 RepID=UPI001EE4B43F|nr:redox-sensing transcriptional repressor Rex [Salsipaludibacter albus]MBY5161097.1 redox-sensing transcriptional repressor Rex [Salsipaludibacter albus]